MEAPTVSPRRARFETDAAPRGRREVVDDVDQRQPRTVIQHNDGDRELYVHRRSSDEDPAIVLELHDDEARRVGALLGGA